MAAPNPTATEDSQAAFRHVPWVSALINRPDIVCRVPNSRRPKSDKEDSLYAETLKSSRTIQHCICVYRRPAQDEATVEEVSVIIAVGDGLNGWPAVLHGGVTATIVDESMGIFQSVNSQTAHLMRVKQGKAEGELPPQDVTSFTGELKIRYLRQIRTPGYMMIVVRQLKKEGRKRWLAAEVKQCASEKEDGELVTCATGDAVFIEPRTTKI